MPGTGIQFTNMSEVLNGLKSRKDKVQPVLVKTAKQMGVMAANEIHPLTNKKTHNWDNSIHPEVHELEIGKVELWVGSKGAFSKDGYNYGARQERLYHPIEIGFHKALPAMRDLYQTNVTEGLGGRTSAVKAISQAAVDEFAMMSGGF